MDRDGLGKLVGPRTVRSPSIARSAVIIPAKCLHDKGEGELREGVRVDGRSLDESRHKLYRLMKSLLAKNGAEIYVLGKLCAKAWRDLFITPYRVSLFFYLARIRTLNIRYLRIFRSSFRGQVRTRAESGISALRGARPIGIAARERIVYVCSHILCWHKKA